MAVLVDEYDKPILDALDTPEIARANRDYLRRLVRHHKGGCTCGRQPYLGCAASPSYRPPSGAGRHP